MRVHSSIPEPRKGFTQGKRLQTETHLQERFRGRRSRLVGVAQSLEAHFRQEAIFAGRSRQDAARHIQAIKEWQAFGKALATASPLQLKSLETEMATKVHRLRVQRNVRLWHRDPAEIARAKHGAIHWQREIDSLLDALTYYCFDILPTLKGGDSLCVGEVGECALERIALVADVG
ncbi:MAG: hypothetical protein J4203_05685, partial [Candidatus Diapherotrites archaeon]|nr:hypothetical protein [Candidatus Diapherotrites archaeon]